MASCSNSFINKPSDSFTQWKDAYLHRGMCQMDRGTCDIHDTPEILQKYQEGLREKIEADTSNRSLRKALLKAHEAEWGKYE
jgi:hypothetical protein